MHPEDLIASAWLMSFSYSEAQPWRQLSEHWLKNLPLAPDLIVGQLQWDLLWHLQLHALNWLSVAMYKDPSTAQRERGTVDISYSPIVSSSFGTKFGWLPCTTRNLPNNLRSSRNVWNTHFCFLYPLRKGLQFEFLYFDSHYVTWWINSTHWKTYKITLNIMKISR